LELVQLGLFPNWTGGKRPAANGAIMGAYLRTYRRGWTIHVLAAGAFSVGEYALVYRAGLSNETRPFKLRLWDKSCNFAHGPLQI
jgi:hypothetical protein